MAEGKSSPLDKDTSLQWSKFSIENILKPSFGRGIVWKASTPIFQASQGKSSFRRYDRAERFSEHCVSSDRCSSPPAQFSTPNLKTLSRLLPSAQSPTEDGPISPTVDVSSRVTPPSSLLTPPPCVPAKCHAAESSSVVDTAAKSTTSTPWPAWVFCTRYSDRPSSGPRSRRIKKNEPSPEEKRPRTAFSNEQLSRLRTEFDENRYLTEKRRENLARELGLNGAQIKIWFQNKRAKLKKSKNEKNPLALQLMAQGLYNHGTIAPEEEEFLQKMTENSS